MGQSMFENEFENDRFIYEFGPDIRKKFDLTGPLEIVSQGVAADYDGDECVYHYIAVKDKHGQVEEYMNTSYMFYNPEEDSIEDLVRRLSDLLQEHEETVVEKLLKARLIDAASVKKWRKE